MSIGSSMSASSSALRQSINQPPLHSDASRVSVLSDRTMTKQNETNQQMAAGAATEAGGGQQQSSPSSGSVISSGGAATVAPWGVCSGDSETPLLDNLHLPTFGSQGNALSAVGGESGATLSTLLSHVNSCGSRGDFAGISNAGTSPAFLQFSVSILRSLPYFARFKMTLAKCVCIVQRCCCVVCCRQCIFFRNLRANRHRS